MIRNRKKERRYEDKRMEKESNEEKLMSAEGEAKAVNEQQAEVVNKKEEGTEPESDNTGEREESSEEQEENVIETGGKTQNIEKRLMSESLRNMEESDEGAQKIAGTIADVAVVKTGGKSGDGKSKVSRKKVTGFIEIGVALILIALSVRLFLNTRGTRLLYVSVTTGHISRYFWIFILVAMVFGVTGAITLKRCNTGKQL